MNTLKQLQTESGIVYFFGCALDFETQTLQTKTDVIRLRSKLWQLLIELMKKPNKLVLREMLIENIWHGNIYTGEQGLTHAVCHLRQIFKKYNIQAQIITLPKKGYILQENESDHLNVDTIFKTFNSVKKLKEDNNQTDFQNINTQYHNI